MQSSPTGFELRTTYFFLNFLVVIFPLVLTIDGVEVKGKWGSSFYPTSPGAHTVTAAWKMYWVLPVNKGTTQINVGEGQVARLVYKVPFLFLLPGKIEHAAG